MSSAVVGTINTLTTVFILVIYLPCLAVIGFDSELKTRSCFRIMFHLGLSDLMLSTLEFFFALLTAIGLGDRIPTRLNAFLAPFIGSCWYSATMFLLLLAVNRWSIMSQKLEALFSQKNEAFEMLIALVWLYSFGWLLALEQTEIEFYYYPSSYVFYYGSNNTYSGMAKKVSWYHNQLVLWPAALFYILGFIAARAERKAVDQVPTEELDSALRSTERSLLKQGAVIFIYCWLLGGEYWHSAPLLMEWGFEYAMALGNWLWVTNAAVNPIVYLTINKTIKCKVIDLLRGKKEQTISRPNLAGSKRAAKIQTDAAVLEEVV